MKRLLQSKATNVKGGNPKNSKLSRRSLLSQGWFLHTEVSLKRLGGGGLTGDCTAVVLILLGDSKN